MKQIILLVLLCSKLCPIYGQALPFNRMVHSIEKKKKAKLFRLIKQSWPESDFSKPDTIWSPSDPKIYRELRGYSFTAHEPDTSRRLFRQLHIDIDEVGDVDLHYRNISTIEMNAIKERLRKSSYIRKDSSNSRHGIMETWNKGIINLWMGERMTCYYGINDTSWHLHPTWDISFIWRKTEARP